MNVLVILTDQQRGDATGATGWDELHTPHLDSLTASGALWTRALCESPECVPARAAILTGLPPMRSGVTDNSTPLQEGSWTLPRALRTAGYATWAVGKQHFRPHRADHGFDRLILGEPLATGDDEYLTFLDDHGYGWIDEPWGVRRDSYYLPQTSPLPDELHITTWTADATIAQLVRSSGESRPFFGIAGFLKPHPPFDPTVPFAHLYDPEVVRRPVDPSGLLEPFPVEAAQLHSKWREETGAMLTQSLRAHYMASISQVDVQVGRILTALNELALVQSTIVVFLSDHGELLGDHGLWGKRSFLAGACNIPLVIRAPGLISPGTRIDALASHVDLAPTLLAATGVEIPHHLPGRNLLDCRESPAQGVVATYSSGSRAIVSHHTSRFRWSYSIALGAERLFDLEVDPDECHNLAVHDPDHPQLEQSRGYVETQLAELDDPLRVLKDGRLKIMSDRPTVRRHQRNRQPGRRPADMRSSGGADVGSHPSTDSKPDRSLG